MTEVLERRGSPYGKPPDYVGEHTISAHTPGILKVNILVDVKERETLADHADLSSLYDVMAVNRLATQLQSP